MSIGGTSKGFINFYNFKHINIFMVMPFSAAKWAPLHRVLIFAKVTTNICWNLRIGALGNMFWYISYSEVRHCILFSILNTHRIGGSPELSRESTNADR